MSAAVICGRIVVFVDLDVLSRLDLECGACRPNVALDVHLLAM